MAPVLCVLRFARLQKLHCALAGRTVFLRVECRTGDAMGMNMVSKGTQALLGLLSSTFPDLQVRGRELTGYLGKLKDMAHYPQSDPLIACCSRLAVCIRLVLVKERN